MTRARAALAGLALAIAGCAGGGGAPEASAPVAAAEAIPALQRFEYRQVVMAIEARLVLYAPDEATAKAAASAAFAELERLDAVFSDYREDSEVMQLCRETAVGTEVQVSFDFFWTLGLSGTVHRESQGAFDPSVGPLTHLWRQARRMGSLPAREEIAAALERCGFGKAWTVRTDVVERRPVAFLTLLLPGVRFDLGGIAKGYAIGMAFDTVRDLGLRSVMVEMGGDVVVGDRPPGEDGWLLDVPAADGSRRQLVLENAVLATSGDASQGFEVDGVRYSHVVDPRSGWPLTSGLGCTLVQPFGFTYPFGNRGGHPSIFVPALTALADARATAATIVGPHDGRRLVVEAGASYVAVTDPAFRPLFDGASLAGWTTRGGRYDGDAVWSVEDGTITGRTGPGDAGGLLYTESTHTSFELQCEVRLEHPFDSGLFVRMAPDARGVQLTLDDRPGGEIGALYSDGFLEHARPEAAAAWRRGEWNHVFLRCTGFDMRLEAWINGVHVMDRVVPQEHDADGRPVFAPRGLIGLQVHGGGSEGAGHAAQFRDVLLRELPVLGETWAEDRTLSPPARKTRDAARAAEGWRDLLAPGAEGDALAAWEAVDGEGDPRTPSDYRVVDGVLEIPSSEPAGYLRTREDFGDVALRLDFQLARMANGGLFLRGRREGVGPDGARVPAGNPAFSGCEIQLLDDANWEAVTGTTLEDWQLTGSLYGAVAPFRRGLSRPPGEWNTLELLAHGSRMACALNGQTLWDVDTAALDVDPPFATRAREGFLGLQRYAAPDVEGGAAVRVRDLFVRRP